MDYKKVYDALMEKRRSNPVPNDEYGERHHIVPRSEGGTDDSENLVRLTAREHYIAHLLLAKIYNDFKMYSAVTYMQCRTNTQNRDYKFNSRLYEKMRISLGNKISERNKGRTPWNKGKKLPDEVKQKISKSTKEAMWCDDVRERFLEGIKDRKARD